MDLSIIIVNYNTPKLTIDAINSVIKTTKDLIYEIIVLDNGSSDNSISEITDTFLDKIIFIDNKFNLGFSKANNIGMSIAKGDYILLLNSDTVVKENTIDDSLSYIKQNKDIGALGCKILLKNGTLDKACKRGFPTPWNSLAYMLKLDKAFKNKKFGGYNLTYLNQDEINEVDCLMGAYMIVPREVIEKVGMLDETFFMYGEDIDWCYRIKSHGFKIVYYPKVEILHYKKASSAKKRTKTIYEFNRAMIVFYNKHYKSKYNIFVSFAVYLGVAIKLILSLLINIVKRG
ncbi:glycosyltransferase family 2 protein [Clostridium algidicarnis]|uniref:glycosyltransferase family 2 protein n=1 Tax=Clostridium algidicarnis TaxID=37659 RepID=UPI001627CE62|nr:glycosyltransferase family 2 protein [Clostridium algidicarnis]MBB6698270.1 glycosyltransferase family 2 protein [Clostridium algidicarnis]MBU3197397.1 glycosyltransferase family 2 protein [Clostridium algidicarnis]